MGNVLRVDKTLPTNDMVYYVRKDRALQKRWLAQDDKYHAPGNSKLARYIVNESAKHGLQLAYI